MNNGNVGPMLGMGYNILWLAMLYVVGAYIKLYPVGISTPFLLLISVFCTIIPLLIFVLGVSYAVFSYTALHTVIYAISLFVLFTRINISSRFVQKIISCFASVSFSVYLIHCHPWISKLLFAKMPGLYFSMDYPWWFSLVFGVVLYLAASIVDFIRISIFRLCRVNKVSDWVAGGIERMVKKLMPKLKRLLE